MACLVLIAGCGDLGSAVARILIQQDFDVCGLRYRSAVVPDGVHLIRADVTNPDDLEVLSSLQPQILLYCVAADAQTDGSYQAHYANGLVNVLEKLKPSNSVRHVFLVSSTRVFGQQTDEWLDERSPAQPADFGGARLLEAEGLLSDTGIPYTILRLSGIYGPGRTRLIGLARRPRDWPVQNTWTSRIHRDDAAAFIAQLIVQRSRNESVESLYLVTDSRPVPQYEVLMWLAEKQGITAGIGIPDVKGGKRLSNSRMLATGFSLAYPDYQAGYVRLIESM
ncbi:hypothetical protein MTYP_02172 [Methylophilaceae bacterium]|nr:hypothetical protein MTYP_02172 [Methylophilaceae bacterium]